MKTLRAGVAGALVLLMGGGYFASQAAYFSGTTSAYIKALDASPVPWLALVLLGLSTVLAFIPVRKEDQE